MSTANASASVPKPKSAYQFFFEIRRRELMADKSNEMVGVLSSKLPVLLSEAWAKMHEENRTEFYEMAEHDKLRYEGCILQQEVSDLLEYQIGVLQIENDALRDPGLPPKPKTPASGGSAGIEIDAASRVLFSPLDEETAEAAAPTPAPAPPATTEAPSEETPAETPAAADTKSRLRPGISIPIPS
jgi:hypothetical protein